MAELCSGRARRLRRSGCRLRRRSAASGSCRADRDMGRAARLAGPDRAARGADDRGRTVSVVDLGREPEPLRVAGRVGVPLLGLPLALPAARSRGHADRSAAARACLRGGTDDVAVSDYSNMFLALHVGLVLAGLAGADARGRARGSLPLAGATAQAPRGPHPADPLPALVTLDELAARTIAISLPALTLGILAGFVGLARAESVDALMAVTLARQVVYGTFLFLRWSAGWRDDAARTSPCSAWRSCSASSSASPSRTSHDACPRRHLVPSRPRRAPGEDGGGRAAGR